MPGLVRFSLDLRATSDAALAELELRMRADFERIADGEDLGGLERGGTPGGRCGVRWELDFESRATRFHEDCVGCVEGSAGVVEGGVQRGMVSGAGHDSVSLLVSLFLLEE